MKTEFSDVIKELSVAIDRLAGQVAVLNPGADLSEIRECAMDAFHLASEFDKRIERMEENPNA